MVRTNKAELLNSKLVIFNFQIDISFISKFILITEDIMSDRDIKIESEEDLEDAQAHQAQEFMCEICSNLY